MMFKGYKVRLMPTRIMKDFEGMNYQAAKVFNFKPLPKPNEVFIDKNMPQKIKIQTIKHEVEEVKLMKSGMPYWDAHIIALKVEHDTAPRFNVHYNQGINIKNMLRR